VSSPRQSIGPASFSFKSDAGTQLNPRAYVSDKPRELASHLQCSVVQLIRQQAEKWPQAPAIIEGPSVLSYGELDQRSSEIAKQLRLMGVTREVLVGVYAARSIELVVSALGVMKAGGAYMPLDPAYPKDRLAFQVADSGADIIVVADAASQNEITAFAKHVLVCTRKGRAASTAETVEPAFPYAGPEDLAYVIYTSGSTGRPKGVEIIQSNLMNMIAWYVEALEVTETDKLSQVAAVGFDASVWELWPALTAGAAISIVDKTALTEPRLLQEWLSREAITISFIPTPMAEKLMELKWPRQTSLRVMMTGGDTLHCYPPADLPFKVVNNYGPTECTICSTSTVLPAKDTFDRLPPIGLPIKNAQIYIVDHNLQQVPQGIEGEILIGGRGVGRGYRNRPEQSAERFIPNLFDPCMGKYLYRTGDRACYHADGQILFKGRIDDQIKIRGVRMEPAEIEAALNEHPGVSESAIMAREFGSGDKRLVAYIVKKGTSQPLSAELRSFLARRLPVQMIPAIFVAMDRLPINSSGKIDRSALSSSNKEKLSAMNVGGDARDNLEERLKEIWERVFRIDNIGIQDDYFEIGGDSLLAIELMTRVSESLRMDLPLSSLLEVRTIEEMAKAIRAQGSSKIWSSLVAVQPKGWKPPLFCVHSHTGDVLYCEYISRGAGPEQPIYGLQAQDKAGKPEHQTIEAMAQHYVNELQRCQARGPYHLFGFCFGGMVAFQIAELLGQQGEEVAFLGIYNSPAPGTLKGWPLGQFTYLKNRARDEWRKLEHLDRKEKAAHVLRNIRNFRILVQRTAAIELSEALLKFWQNGKATSRLNLEAIHIAAAKRFKPSHVFPGRITMFLSPEVAGVYPISPADGWRTLAAKGLEIINVPLDDKGWRGSPFVEIVGGNIAQLFRSGEAKAQLEEEGLRL
jgi:amino acid adenylation domain-containing protein